QNLARASRNIIYLRTPVNALKAGALNFGIKHLMGFKKAPQVVFTFDDDVQINQQTLPLLINGLYATKRTGAVCSMAIVKNKHTNLLTRLQALEYLSFNISKIADNGFLQGPLVMQGMLTAFRMSALRQVRGFTEGHLIEDYDITAKLKYLGWNVRLIFQAKAWTTVPEDLESLWKQRVRWTYGGMGVVSDYWRMPAVVFQDLLGHTVFLSLVFLILTSFLLPRVSFQSPLLVVLIFSLSIINFIQAFLFSILIIFKLPGWEKQDLLLRLSILPEFIYCNFLSLILIGSYLFFVFNFLMSKIVTNLLPAEPVYHLGLKAFKRIGYSTSWGTRQA
ncbi:MAG: glycosyltransferase, partial [Patescibacteria group bacterium]|nr:glycosyltransferase [Patescibacteria group bacterium]